mmetsp:Transcript_41836/g.99314  ORF Transcript_41836/g.99314 Transcript_41836/m.99314 type:complete len:88 (-) Transcript_41836:56-319(-)
MFAVLVKLHSLSATVSSAGVSSDGSEALTSALTAVSGAGGGGAASSRLAATGQLNDSQLEEKQKSKAKQGFCETVVWNCSDLYGPGN